MKKSELSRLILLLSLVLTGGLASQGAMAADDDDDIAVSRAPVEKPRQRNYPGGREEQDLEIQASLARPTRSADGSAIANIDDASAEAPSPETD